MFKDKKYLIASGCSFTKGHILKEPASWATHFAQNNDCELINLAKGGFCNQEIVKSVIEYSISNVDRAQDSFFIIQVSDFARHLICWEDFTPEIDNPDVCVCCNSVYHSFTPSFFLDLDNKTKEEWFENWPQDDKLCNWLYENRYALAPLYVNTTNLLIDTYSYIISLVNFFEANNYPYLIFDGIHGNIPVIQDNKWYMTDRWGDALESLKIIIKDSYDNTTTYPHLSLDVLNYIKNIRNYYTDTTQHKFVHNRRTNMYYKGNDGHPNELGAKMWAKELDKIIIELYDENR
jgi:hypothetical protein